MKNKCLFKKFYLTLQYCIGFAIYQNESATGIHVFPILNPPPSSLLPPHTIPLGRPSDASFELWCWRRLLRVPWIARSNQSILKEISPEYSLDGMILKLKLQYLAT